MLHLPLIAKGERYFLSNNATVLSSWAPKLFWDFYLESQTYSQAVHKILNIGTDKSKETMQTQIKLIPKEQSLIMLYNCVLFHLHQ